MAKLGSIDSSLYEAARIDGASWWQEARYISIPLVMPMILFINIIKTVGYLQTWIYPNIMAGGGPNNSTSTVALQMYQNAALYGRWGYAAAIGMFLLLITLIFALIQRRLLR